MSASNLTPRIKELREIIGITQLELAQYVGVTENTIANWEKGRRGLNWFERIAKLCEALDCNPEDLFIQVSVDSDKDIVKETEMIEENEFIFSEPSSILTPSSDKHRQARIFDAFAKDIGSVIIDKIEQLIASDNFKKEWKKEIGLEIDNYINNHKEEEVAEAVNEDKLLV